MTNQEQIIQRYLLGELPEAEKEALEEAYFNDRHLFDRMVQAENELVDKYARGLLSPATRESFEKYYLAHPKRRERANFAIALAARLNESNEAGAASHPDAESFWNRLLVSIRGPKLAWGFSMALLLMTLVAAWFFFETKRLRQDLSAQEQRERELQQQATSERQRAEQLAAELERQRHDQPLITPSPIVSFLLSCLSYLLLPSSLLLSLPPIGSKSGNSFHWIVAETVKQYRGIFFARFCWKIAEGLKP